MARRHPRSHAARVRLRDSVGMLRGVMPRHLRREARPEWSCYVPRTPFDREPCVPSAMTHGAERASPLPVADRHLCHAIRGAAAARCGTLTTAIAVGASDCDDEL